MTTVSRLNKCTVPINTFNHNQHTLCEQFYYMATSFDPQLGSSSGHDTRLRKYTETKFRKWEISPFYIKNA